MAISKIINDGIGDIDELTVDTNTLVVDSTNNRVGIGTSSPSGVLNVVGNGSTHAIRVDGLGSSQVQDFYAVRNGSATIQSGPNITFQNPAGGTTYATTIQMGPTGEQLFFNYNGSAWNERMRIDSSGNVLVGTTSQIEGSKVCISAANGLGVNITGAGGGALNANYVSTGTGYFGYFKYNGTVVGSITSTGSSTAYNTSSDYRLKENVTGITDGIERVKQLNPSRFNFIADADTTVDGFLAHEAATVVPEAVTGEKDAVDEDGNPEYQGIDQAKLVPLLTAALKEAITKIEDLEARVATLEGN